MTDADKLVEDCARAIRRNRFERNGTMLKAYDPTIPLTEGELADGLAAVALAVERCVEAIDATILDDRSMTCCCDVVANVQRREDAARLRSLSPNAKGET